MYPPAKPLLAMRFDPHPALLKRSTIFSLETDAPPRAGCLDYKKRGPPPTAPRPVSLPFPPRTLDRSAGCATGFPAAWPPRRPHDERALPRRARSGGVRSGGAPSSNSGRRRSFSPEPFPAGANLTRAFRPLDCVISFVGLPTESSLLSEFRACPFPHYLCIRKSVFFCRFAEVVACNVRAFFEEQERMYGA